MDLYSWAVRPALFALDAERAHDLMMTALRQPMVVGSLRTLTQVVRHDRLRQRLLGLTFDSPIGLGAGLDKQGAAVAAWAALGFGFAEIGTVTPQPQPGNPRPRLFRLPADRAIINRFGFNSAGAHAVAENLAATARTGPAPLRVGVNIGKNRQTPNARAVEDYIAAVEALHAFADYFVVNVSSPNTAGLRDLQEGAPLRALVEQVVTAVRRVSPSRPIAVLVKVSPGVAPDLSPSELLDTVDAALEGGAAGIVATNTTVGRQALRSPRALAAEAGGLSGGPLRHVANDTCARIFRHVGPGVPIIGVGGIFTADDAFARVRAGAALLQIYTALVYEGPGVIARIGRGLIERLERHGFRTLEEARGTDVH